MTKKDFLKELKSYFTEHDWKEYDEKKIMSMLERYRDSVKTIYLVKKVEVERSHDHINIQPSDDVLDSIAKHICEKHNITIEELKPNSPLKCYKLKGRRNAEYIIARADFCRTVSTQAPNIKLTTMRNWFGYKCHSSIIHLLKHSNDITRNQGHNP